MLKIEKEQICHLYTGVGLRALWPYEGCVIQICVWVNILHCSIGILWSLATILFIFLHVNPEQGYICWHQILDFNSAALFTFVLV